MSKANIFNQPITGARNDRGFTLLETTISILIFSALVLIFSTAIPVSHKTACMNGQYAQAISLCQHKIDQLRANGYGRLTYDEMDGIVIDDTPTSSPYSFTHIDDVDSYLPNAVATIAVSYPTTDVAKVTVTIVWNTASYKDKKSSLTLTAWIANTE